MCEPARTITRDVSASFVDSESPFLGEPYRSFQFVKTSALGLGAPQGIAVMIHPIGGTSETPSPVYHTSKLLWMKQRLALPASFDLYAGGNVISHKADSQGEMKLARVSYRGWEGVVGLKCDIEIFVKNESTKFMDNIEDDGPTRRLQLKRKGVGRDYEMRIASTDQGTTQILNWKGSKSTLGLVHDSAPSCNGNLKLVNLDQADRVLAVWKNRTDLSILGALHVLYKLDEGRAGLLEEVIVSCLALVCAERLSARGWLGGLGKSKSIK
jgi:hypothetical protein